MKKIFLGLVLSILTGCVPQTTYGTYTTFSYNVLSEIYFQTTSRVSNTVIGMAITTKDKEWVIKDCRSDIRHKGIEDACILSSYYDEKGRYVSVLNENKEKYLKNNKYAEEYLAKKQIEKQKAEEAEKILAEKEKIEAAKEAKKIREKEENDKKIKLIKEIL